jgi:hypothetical protein
MAVSLDDAIEMICRLPEVTETLRFGHRSWAVGGKVFAWERPFSKADIKRFGDQPVPGGDILALAVGSLVEKDAVLAANPGAFFTIAHFEGYPAVLVQLSTVGRRQLRRGIEDAWAVHAPAELMAPGVSPTPPPGPARRRGR